METEGNQVSIATIHGRFQPFHRGHLQMARQAFERCDYLVIGLTNPDPEATAREAEDPDRHRPNANPFSFWERSFLTRTALLRDGFPAGLFCIVPFSINKMDSWPWEYYMPKEATWYLRVKREWGRRKVKRLKKHGLTVEELPFEKYAEVSGTDIRERMRSGGNWQQNLPEGTIEVVRNFDLRERLL